MGGSVRPKRNWNFQRGGGGGGLLEIISSVGEVMDIFWNYTMSCILNVCETKANTNIYCFQQPSENYFKFDNVLFLPCLGRQQNVEEWRRYVRPRQRGTGSLLVLLD